MEVSGRGWRSWDGGNSWSGQSGSLGPSWEWRQARDCECVFSLCCNVRAFSSLIPLRAVRWGPLKELGFSRDAHTAHAHFSAHLFLTVL